MLDLIDKLKIKRKQHQEEEEKKIKSSPFFLPFQVPSMPAVGTRRSTRVFVLKTGGNHDVDTVLRSGKRLSSSKSEIGKPESDDAASWNLNLNSNSNSEAAMDFRLHDTAVASEREKSPVDSAVAAAQVTTPESVGNFPPSSSSGSINRMFGIVYSRKRRRLPGGQSRISIDRMYGIPFVRKQRRKKLQQNQNENHRGGFEITDSAKNFALEAGVSEGDILLGFIRRAVLLVFVESDSSRGTSSCSRFVYFLVSILRWMRRSRLRLKELAVFLYGRSIARLFSLQGVHLLPVPASSATNLSCINYSREALSHVGICTIFGAQQFVPLISLNFSVLPSYFLRLHSCMVLGSRYIPDAPMRYIMGLYTNKHGNFYYQGKEECSSTKMGISRSKTTLVSGSPHLHTVKRIEAVRVVEGPVVAAQNLAAQPNTKIRKNQKRRSSLRHIRVPNPPLVDLHGGDLCSELNGLVKLDSFSKDSSRERSLGTCTRDFFSGRDEYLAFSSFESYSKQRKSGRKSPCERMKEMKLALSELKQSIDSVRCRANILVIGSDRCWRENGAEVMLECSGSKEWWLAVKTCRGSTRYSHKAQEMRASTCNRYTHAMMWTGGNGWKLEFCDRKDWLIFKELHRECCERNLQAASVRIIPVPGVREVSGYGDSDGVPFVRPDVYMTMGDDEVGRALMSENVIYDMDCGDEAWLEQLNLKYRDDDNGNLNFISEANFENIIYVFEKAAYSHPHDIADENRAINLCLDLGRRDMVSDIYEYWLKKRKQNRLPLVRIFQGSPPRRAQLIQKPFFRKKRSFKRQASQVGRHRLESSYQAEMKQDALRRIQEAEIAANRAMELAMQKRSRAQMLMNNADLATYKSVMALKLAEAARVAESSNAAYMILD